MKAIVEDNIDFSELEISPKFINQESNKLF